MRGSHKNVLLVSHFDILHFNIHVIFLVTIVQSFWHIVDNKTGEKHSFCISFHPLYRVHKAVEDYVLHIFLLQILQLIKWSYTILAVCANTTSPARSERERAARRKIGHVLCVIVTSEHVGGGSCQTLHRIINLRQSHKTETCETVNLSVSPWGEIIILSD